MVAAADESDVRSWLLGAVGLSEKQYKRCLPALEEALVETVADLEYLSRMAAFDAVFVGVTAPRVRDALAARAASSKAAPATPRPETEPTKPAPTAVQVAKGAGDAHNSTSAGGAQRVRVEFPTPCQLFKTFYFANPGRYTTWHFPPALNMTPKPQPAFPSLNVAGLPKAGTSTVYGLLMKMPGVHAAARHKETCSAGRAFGGVHHLLQTYRATQTAAYRSVNGCICLLCNICTAAMLYGKLPAPRDPPIRWIVAVRDAASRAWAAYNYWSHPLDGTRLYSLTSNSTPRSPQRFHTLVVQGHKLRGNWFTPRSFLSPPAVQWVPVGLLRLLRRFVGASNLHVLDIDTLDTDDARLSLARFASLNETLMLRTMRSQRLNSGQIMERRSAQTASVTSSIESGLYAISSFQPAMDATRNLITAACAADCAALQADFGVRLPCAALPPAVVGASELAALASSLNEVGVYI